MKLIIVRHGNVNGHSFEDPELSYTGKTQIEDLGNMLKIKKDTISAIHSSTSKRTKETAEILGQKLDIQVNYNPLLDTVKIPGGKDLERLIAYIWEKDIEWQKGWLEEHEKWPGVEAPKDFKNRTQIVLNFILKEQEYSENKEVLIVGHEETYWAILSLIKKIPLSEAIKENISCGSIRIFKLSKENME